ncbi:hypothetical protein ACMFMG_011533 [Clarireedia jacksonii]
MGKVEYEPLKSAKEIRLLHLLRPKTSNDLIECTLYHHNYDEPLEPPETSYQALSYEWGEQHDDDPEIIVNSCRIQIRKNLHDALEHIWKAAKDQNINLWVDALCINQPESKELSQQIGIMGEIFNNASCVIAWLGLERDNSNVAIEWMAGESPSRSSLDSIKIEAIDKICCRSYWRRVWVIQELFLARSCEVRCGDKCISRDDFDNSLGVRNTKVPGKYALMNPVVQHRLRLSLGSTQYNTLRAWLRACIDGGFECSKEHDRIYGLLGVAGDCTKGRIEVDYNKPLRDVYLEALAAVSGSWVQHHDANTIMIPLAKKMNLEVNTDLQNSIGREL